MIRSSRKFLQITLPASTLARFIYYSGWFPRTSAMTSVPNEVLSPILGPRRGLRRALTTSNKRQITRKMQFFQHFSCFVFVPRFFAISWTTFGPRRAQPIDYQQCAFSASENKPLVITSIKWVTKSKNV